MRTRFDGLLRRLVTLADGVGDRYRDEHCGRRSDPDDQRERHGGDREDGELRQSQRPRAGAVPERLAQEEDLGEQEQRRPPEREDRP
jgi:hypothetical protein